jgi:hypothetical protein
MAKVVRLTENDLVRLVNRVIKEQSESYNLIKTCASLGVKSPGKCDTLRKMPVESCAKLGLKTVGLCYVDTKKPVPKLPSLNNTK